MLLSINVRENRRDNLKLTIQRNWQHRAHKKKINKMKTQHKMWEINNEIYNGKIEGVSCCHKVK